MIITKGCPVRAAFFTDQKDLFPKIFLLQADTALEENLCALFKGRGIVGDEKAVPSGLAPVQQVPGFQYSMYVLSNDPGCIKYPYPAFVKLLNLRPDEWIMRTTKDQAVYVLQFRPGEVVIDDGPGYLVIEETFLDHRGE